MNAVHHAEKTVSTSVVTLATEFAAAQALHAACNAAEINVVDQPIRYTLDGSTPTATRGLRAPADAVISLGKKDIQNFKATREGGTDAECEVAFFA